MPMQIKLREFRESDDGELARIIVDTWEFDEGISDKDKALYLGYLFLYECIMYASYVRVAEADGRPVGIMASTLREKAAHPDYEAKCRYYAEAANSHDEVRKSLETWTDYNNVYKGMEAEPGVSTEGFDAEVTLFIVSESVRGSGVGSMLFKDLLEFYGKEGVRNYRLRTDSDCSYAFYERHGMERISEGTMQWPPGSGKELKLFVYAKRADAGPGAEGGSVDAQMGVFFSLIQGLDRVYGEYARKNGLTYMSLLVLEAIRDNRGCTQKQVCEETNYPKQTVNMIVKSFMDKGWVELVELPGDRRNKAVNLTAEGEAFADKVVDPFWNCARDVLMKMDDQERATAFKVISAFDDEFFAAARNLPKHN